MKTPNSKSLFLFFCLLTVCVPSFGESDPDCKQIIGKILNEVREQNNYNKSALEIFNAQLNVRQA